MSEHLKAVGISIPMPWGPIAGVVCGDPAAMPVLCIHGAVDNLATFNYLLPRLPRHFHYVSIDLPNHGQSAHAHQGYITDLLWYTMSVKRVIDQFGWAKLYILGHGLGGQIGFLLAAIYPESVIKLVVIDSLMLIPHLPSVNTTQAMKYLFFEPTLKFEDTSSSDEAATYSLDEVARKMKKARRTEVSEKQVRLLNERNLTKVGPDQYKYSFDQRTKHIGPVPFSFEQLEVVANEIRCPILVILGKNSLMTKPLDSLNRSPLKNNRNATFRVLEGDHYLHIARPQEVASVITPFLAADTQSKL